MRRTPIRESRRWMPTWISTWIWQMTDLMAMDRMCYTRRTMSSCSTPRENISIRFRYSSCPAMSRFRRARGRHMRRPWTARPTAAVSRSMCRRRCCTIGRICCRRTGRKTGMRIRTACRIWWRTGTICMHIPKNAMKKIRRSTGI